jgi:Domain of unknown function (DUF4160)
MPEISRFFGIVIRMYFSDHPPPHFHAEYAGERAKIDIKSLQILDGQLSPRAYGLTAEWAALHRAELLENWNRVTRAEPALRIVPLD